MASIPWKENMERTVPRVPASQNECHRAMTEHSAKSGKRKRQGVWLFFTPVQYISEACALTKTPSFHTSISLLDKPGQPFGF
jgi:hypothetical protein